MRIETDNASTTFTKQTHSSPSTLLPKLMIDDKFTGFYNSTSPMNRTYISRITTMFGNLQTQESISRTSLRVIKHPMKTDAIKVGSNSTSKSKLMRMPNIAKSKPYIINKKIVRRSHNSYKKPVLFVNGEKPTPYIPIRKSMKTEVSVYTRPRPTL